MSGQVFYSGGVLTKTPYVISPDYSTSWFPSMPPMSSGWWSAYSGIYEKQLWVFVVVSKRAKAVARLPLPVYKKASDDSRERQGSHPMALLLQSPNPGMSGFRLWQWTQSIIDIHGHAFWLKRRKRGQVVALFPLHPASMVETSNGWTFDNGKLVIKDIQSSELVHFMDFHPSSMTTGLSPLEPLRATLENEWHARTATSSFWQRGARPGMALTHPQTISEAAQRRLKAQIDSQSGSTQTGSTLILEEGLTPHPMTLTYEEAQYIETRKLNREEVCAAYDVPPPVVHILDRATFSNITEQMRSMYRDTMAPVLKSLESTIEVDLRMAEWPGDDVYAEFLMDEVLRGDFEARQEAYNKADYMTLAEKRKMENLPFIEGTDNIFLNSASLPLSTLLAAPQPVSDPTAPPETPVADEPAPALGARSHTVIGRLSWQKTLSDVRLDKITAGLSSNDVATVADMLATEMRNAGTVADLRARLLGKRIEL